MSLLAIVPTDLANRGNMLSRRLFVLLCAGVVALGSLSGCSNSPKLAQVSGVLTYKGKPAPNVIVNFYPENGRPSWGLTDATGQFTLEYDKDNKGALIGKHKVSVKMGPPIERNPGVEPSPPRELAELFEKYGDNSSVVVEIEANTKEITLAWD